MSRARRRRATPPERSAVLAAGLTLLLGAALPLRAQTAPGARRSPADPASSARGVAAPDAAAAFPGTLADTLDAAERRIAAAVAARHEEAVAFLQRVVDVNSGTGNLAGVREVGRLFRARLDSLGFATRWVSPAGAEARAGDLFAERDGPSGRRVLLIGHLDTVYEPDDPFQRFVRLDSLARGPGTIDAKGGAVAILYALVALHDAGVLDGARIVVGLMGDEETPAHPFGASRAELLAQARRSDVALAFEPAANGTIGAATPVRLGFAGWRLRIPVDPAGNTPRADALGRARSLVRRFGELAAGEPNLEIYPLGAREEAAGGAVGGDAASGAALTAIVVEGGVRAASSRQLEDARRRMRRLIAEHGDVRLEFDADPYPGMPPRPENFALLRALDAVSRALGDGPVVAGDPSKRGGGDISFVAEVVPGLDGLGPAGGGAHSPQEMVDLRSLAAATRRAAILVYRLTRGG
ncbi:MAG: M20/M25/M40 family metallo-hydrolase [Gemmatimonadetes bacterium]|nr:M20/M25/M40 family metallo-hydrolase [Gemmatimonadota bacterium]